MSDARNIAPMKNSNRKSESAQSFGQHKWHGTAESRRSGIEARPQNYLLRERMFSKLAFDDGVHSSPGGRAVAHNNDLCRSERRRNYLHASTELPCHVPQ